MISPLQNASALPVVPKIIRRPATSSYILFNQLIYEMKFYMAQKISFDYCIRQSDS